jgi:glycosyltransferase involved in cell wall biosynthesis
MKWNKILFIIILLSILTIFIWERPSYVLHKSRIELTALPFWTPHDVYAATTSGKCIVWIMNTYPPYGASGNEMCTHAMNQALLAKGYEVWVGVPGFPSVVYEGVRCFDLRNRNMLNTLLRRTHIIGACTLMYKPAAVQLAQRFQTAFLDCIHTYAIKRDYWEDLGDLGNRFWVVFNTNWMREYYKEDWKEQSIMLHPPVDWKQYVIPPEQRKPVFVTLINCNSNKGGGELIQIAKKAPEFKFMGVLGGYDKQVTNNNIENLTYYPHTPNIRTVYAKTWCLLILSKWETYGRVAIEAMSSGIPVIATPLTGIKEACGDAAIYHERDDFAGIISTLRKLKNDNAFYQQMSEKCLERAKSMNTVSDVEQLCKWVEEKVVPSSVPLESRRPYNLGFFENVLPQDLA